MSSDVIQPTPSPRIHGVDFARGLACISMPFFHITYNLYALGLVDTPYTRSWFWFVYQKLGLGTFVFVSGMAFVLSTASGIRWQRLGRRALKLGVVAACISLVTYIAMPGQFVRFGVIHFFAFTLLLAPLLRGLRYWLVLPGLAIVALGVWVGKAGMIPEPWLYITGLMSERPRSIDYIPLAPWFGVFLLGMAAANALTLPDVYQPAKRWMRPVIWLGQHSLPFYLIHQGVIYAVMWLLALWLK